jgi:hypothetical protein
MRFARLRRMLARPNYLSRSQYLALLLALSAGTTIGCFLLVEMLWWGFVLFVGGMWGAQWGRGWG